MIEIENINLDYTPLLRKQLINYICINYEEAADYSEEVLVEELIYLYKHNLMDMLPLAEYLSSTERLEREFGC